MNDYWHMIYWQPEMWDGGGINNRGGHWIWWFGSWGIRNLEAADEQP